MEVVGVYAVSRATKEKRQPERVNQPVHKLKQTVAIQDNRRMVSRSKAMLNATVHRKPKKRKEKTAQAVKTECRAHARNETNQGAPPDPVPVSSCAREQNNKRKRYYFYDLSIHRSVVVGLEKSIMCMQIMQTAGGGSRRSWRRTACSRDGYCSSVSPCFRVRGPGRRATRRIRSRRCGPSTLLCPRAWPPST